ncbi:hypothetical protein K4L02_19975 (plasmid) [Phaeobacter inhibens]|uniref:hypothetical protein n=1 Tax=Phaeobacter inhibens TaxID=221822 RepID=UPI0021A7A9FF|nr:hypothetical protein [Phaeobacter inhibens]UWR66874.1 hypothetical protein K4L02_19975 [Phaeobacter inhibens]
MVEVAITLARDDPTLEQLPLADDHLIALLSNDGEWPVQLSPQGLLSLPLIMIKGGSEPLVRACLLGVDLTLISGMKCSKSHRFWRLSVQD